MPINAATSDRALIFSLLPNMKYHSCTMFHKLLVLTHLKEHIWTSQQVFIHNTKRMDIVKKIHISSTDVIHKTLNQIWQNKNNCKNF